MTSTAIVPEQLSLECHFNKERAALGPVAMAGGNPAQTGDHPCLPLLRGRPKTPLGDGLGWLSHLQDLRPWRQGPLTRRLGTDIPHGLPHTQPQALHGDHPATSPLGVQVPATRPSTENTAAHWLEGGQ